jgi:hypothetical protein
MTQARPQHAPYSYPSPDIDQILRSLKQWRAAKITLALGGLAAVVALFVATQYLTLIGRPAPGQSANLLDEAPTAPVR